MRPICLGRAQIYREAVQYNTKLEKEHLKTATSWGVPGNSAIVTFMRWWVKTWPELKGWKGDQPNDRWSTVKVTVIESPRYCCWELVHLIRSKTLKNLPWPPNSKPRLHTIDQWKKVLFLVVFRVFRRGVKNYPVMAQLFDMGSLRWVY